MIDLPVLVNSNVASDHQFDFRAVLRLATSGPFPTVSVSVSQNGPCPLQQELDNLKLVMGDLLREKLSGVKVYVVIYEPDTSHAEAHPTCHLSLEAAKAWITLDRSAGPNPLRELDWTAHVIGTPPFRRWYSDSSYGISEHQIS